MPPGLYCSLRDAVGFGAAPATSCISHSSCGNTRIAHDFGKGVGTDYVFSWSSAPLARGLRLSRHRDVAVAFLGGDPVSVSSASRAPRRSAQHGLQTNFTVVEDGEELKLVLPEWEHVDGLPKVAQTATSVAYKTPDMADGPDETTMRPDLACKCGDWRPTASHPAIIFKEPFLKQHEEIEEKLARLRVHMADVTENPPLVHWDAEFDMKRFHSGPNLLAGHPAVAGVGSQIRFMTFCPDHGPHTYELRVTGLDAHGSPLPYLYDEKTTFTATPAEVLEAPSPAENLAKNEQAIANKIMQG